jgi:hypothetical protein
MRHRVPEYALAQESRSARQLLPAEEPSRPPAKAPAMCLLDAAGRRQSREAALAKTRASVEAETGTSSGSRFRAAVAAAAAAAGSPGLAGIATAAESHSSGE